MRPLFRDYRDWLAEHRDPDESARSRVEAGLATIDELIARLPGSYGPPRGDVLLWMEGDEIAACGALRELSPGTAEAKRVSVIPKFRGEEFGRRYVRSLIERARELGYEKLRVDTLSSMKAAIEFYGEAGFRPIPPFWSHPAAGALFFELRLGR